VQGTIVGSKDAVRARKQRTNVDLTKGIGLEVLNGRRRECRVGFEAERDAAQRHLEQRIVLAVRVHVLKHKQLELVVR